MIGRWLSAVGIVGLLVACSSSESTGSGQVSSVDGAKIASALSDGEAGQYCKDVQSYAASKTETLKKFGCIFVAAFSTLGAKTDDEAKTTCKKAYDDCLVKPATTTSAEADAGAAPDPCVAFTAKLKTCPATVSDLNQCVTDQLQALDALNGEQICSEAKAPSSEPKTSSSSTGKLDTPASCAKLKESCPTLFSTSGSSASSAEASP